jgi:hypothetical protein
LLFVVIFFSPVFQIKLTGNKTCAEVLGSPLPYNPYFGTASRNFPVSLATVLIALLSFMIIIGSQIIVNFEIY